MKSYFNRGLHSWCSKLFRLRYSWTLCFVFSAGIVILFRLHYGRQQELIELINDAVVAHDDLTDIPAVTFPSTATTTSSTTTQTTTSTSTTAPATTEQTSSFKSSCSAAADRRGPHQNVIGYSIYGGNFSEPKFYRKYLKPFTDTLRTIPIRYPGIAYFLLYKKLLFPLAKVIIFH
jgi:hypothetical protein